MTSGNFTSILISSIQIDRTKRQRKQLKNLDELSWSISSVGLINPIVIDAENNLVAGECRLEACRALGWTHIPAQYTTDLPQDELHLIELEENVRRQALDWKDECLAIESYHQLRKQRDKEWTAAKTADALLISTSEITRRRQVAEELTAGNEAVLGADKLSVAKGLVARARERQAADTTASAEAIVDVTTGQAATVVEAKQQTAAKEAERKVPILNKDFMKWASNYKGEKFNLIHCDFPYGINADKQKQGNNVTIHGGYEDSEALFLSFILALQKSMNNVIADSAHLIFWFSMRYYYTTLNDLEEMGWTVDPFPLVWHKSCNTGLLPDPDRGPRRTYETAFFASRGDRKIVRAVGNSISGPSGGTSRIHMSEKPRPICHHFLRMLTDEYTTFLDPTCGSGNAVRTAELLGAKRVLGIEKDKEFYRRAKEHYYD